MKYLTLGLLLLMGCPKKTVTVTCTWTGSGNPVPACTAVPVPKCLLNYTLTRQDTGAVIATIPITATSYKFSASTKGLSGPVTLGLAVNEMTANGVVSSPKALSSVTVN